MTPSRANVPTTTPASPLSDKKRDDRSIMLRISRIASSCSCEFCIKKYFEIQSKYIFISFSKNLLEMAKTKPGEGK